MPVYSRIAAVTCGLPALMRIYTDTELIELIRASDKQAFDQLYHRYWRLLYMLAVQKTGAPPEAEDIVQEIFIDLWNKRARLEVIHNLRPYLVSTAYHKIFHFFRDKGVREKHLEDFAQFLGQMEGVSVESIDLSAAVFETEFGRLQDIITATIDLMPGQMKKVAMMRYRQSMTASEIADELGISPLTVKKHLQIAMKRLREAAGQPDAGSTALLVLLWLTHSSY